MSRLKASVMLLCLALSSRVLADLAVYDVDAKYRQEVYAALLGVLRPEDGRVMPTGTVEMLPTGQILVDTSAARHEQVVAVLDAINAHQAEPAPRVTLRYWAVLGSRFATPDSNLPEILAGTLDELRRVHGDLNFQVLGNATLVTESGQSGDLSGNPFSISQLAYVQDTTLNAELRINFTYSVVTGQYRGQSSEQGGGQAVNPFSTIQREQLGVRLNTSLEPGEFLVVGESSAGQIGVEANVLEGTIFYIVNWPASE